MSYRLRKIFPYLVLVVGVMAMVWAASFGTLPRADFAFNNGDEIHTVDPAKATGSPEGRVINGLFEGLLRQHPLDVEPDEDGIVPLAPATHGVAESYTVSDDGRVYTFRIRPTARWSNNEPLTAHDFVWSWRRMLHPETGSQYAYQLYYVTGAEAYNLAQVEVGARVEVELADRRDPQQLFPRGTILQGILTKTDDADENFSVEVKSGKNGEVDWDSPGTVRHFSKLSAERVGEGERCHHLLPDFDSQVGIQVNADDTLVVTLNNRTPYFTDLVAFYPLYPVNRACVEKHGTPTWTKPQNIVSNGPFLLQFRRIRDRVRMVKNPLYWNAGIVELEIIDAMAISSNTTSLNMFINGQLDWATTVPNSIIPDLRDRNDFKTAPMLTTYFYRLNIERVPLDNVLVRRALNMAIDKKVIVEKVTKAGQLPARSYVPPGLPGFKSALCGEFNPQKARQLLAEAGFENGRGLPRIEILYNTSESHRDIAQVIQQDWKKNLGIDVILRNLEWGTFLDTLNETDYAVARSGWIGDYADPNTFLDMFVTGGTNNETNWGNTEYDRLIEAAGAETDMQRRLEMLHQAERILMDEMPIIPIYFYRSINLVHARVEGFSSNIQDVHPLHLLRIKAFDD
jgi:oligopeptide transport system substrate-binding protein